MRLPAAILAVLLLTSCSTAPAAPPEPTPAHELNRRLGRGINFGNALEAPNEGDWGVTVKESYFDAVKAAGFDSVRLPIKWSAHAAEKSPYAIDPKFFNRIDSLVDQALKRDLAVIVDFHHYDELYDHPDEHEARFLALWRQIAARYKDRPPTVYFELANEPHKPLTPERWNALIPRALAAVRETNPNRGVIIGSGEWNAVWTLEKLELPPDDRIIVTVHDYSPHHFTHQGASWAEGSDEWLGMKWGTEADKTEVRKDLEKAAAWGKAHNRPIFLGEFGVYEKADMESRAKWTAFVRSEAERLGMSWAYWEFGAGFGIYDPAKDEWRTPLKNALLGTSAP